METSKMGEKGQPLKSSKMHATILAVIGIILVFVGVAIATVHNPLRGSGLGTISVVAGIALLVIALLRFKYKRA
jgi:hypothetical protein